MTMTDPNHNEYAAFIEDSKADLKEAAVNQYGHAALMLKVAGRAADAKMPKSKGGFGVSNKRFFADIELPAQTGKEWLALHQHGVGLEKSMNFILFKVPVKPHDMSGEVVDALSKAEAYELIKQFRKDAKHEGQADADAVAKPAIADPRVIRCSCRELIGHVEAESLDAVFTDPPYPEEFLPCWTELGEFAAHALRPGGLLLALTGQMFLPDVLERLLASGMEYRWMAAYAYAKPRGNYHAAKVSCGWKPALAFRKPGPQADFYSEDAFKAVPRSGKDKAEHEWGQTTADMAAIAQEWLRPGWKVADPFCGAGAMMAAAAGMGCEVVGCDIDERHCETTRRKLAEVKIGV